MARAEEEGHPARRRSKGGRTLLSAPLQLRPQSVLEAGRGSEGVRRTPPGKPNFIRVRASSVTSSRHRAPLLAVPLPEEPSFVGVGEEGRTEEGGSAASSPPCRRRRESR
jgi:hypothetical protein